MSAPPSSPEDIARRLVGDATVTPARRGGNNRLYRVEAGGRAYALKLYLRDGSDKRDRLDTEFRALDFLNRHDVACVPRALARDDAAGAGLYSWIEGEAVTSIGECDLAQAVDFLAALHGLRDAAGAAELPLASEACLSRQDILDQIGRRWARLLEIEHAELAEFLDGPFAAAFERLAARAGPFDQAPLSLSPSDFGFHNALTQGGQLTFLDFEYFGRDDPVKLVADTLLHPGFFVPQPEKQRFVNQLRSLYAADEYFGLRFESFAPLFGLRWCMIVLNEFLPERWRRRAFAGADDRASAQARQLGLARTLLATALDLGGRA